jgi:pilus assembly protein Flp/PilA
MSHYARYIACWFGVESEKGVTAIEYGLIAALIGVAIVTGVTNLGTTLSAKFASITGHLT